MPAVTTLKSSRTREKKALIRERTEASVLLQAEWTDNPQEMLKLHLSIGQALLSLETKLTRLEAANDKLVDALEQAEDDEVMQQFQTTLDEESELIDDTITKMSQLKVMKEEIEKKRKDLEGLQDRDLEHRVTRVQEQVDRLQSTQPSLVYRQSRVTLLMKHQLSHLNLIFLRSMEMYLNGRNFGTHLKPQLTKVGTHWLTR